MSKLIAISVINVLFCTFMMNVIKATAFCNDLHIVYIFMLYTIYAISLFVYQRWINKKVFPFFFRNKHKYDELSLSLAYTIVGVVFGRVLTIANILTYFIKISQFIKYNPNELNAKLFAAFSVHIIVFLVISGMTAQGFLDIKIKDIKRMRWNEKNETLNTDKAN